MGEKRKRAIVYLYTGTGAGKTVSSLGLALRSLGHDHKVVMVQFMKGRKDVGEYMVQKRLSPNYEVHQFGRPEFINMKNPDPADIEFARKGLEFAKKIANEKAPNLLILDEINLAVAVGLLKLDEVLNFLDEVPPETKVVITGRFADKKLIDRADFATEIKQIKRPDLSVVGPHEGIEY